MIHEARDHGEGADKHLRCRGRELSTAAASSASVGHTHLEDQLLLVEIDDGWEHAKVGHARHNQHHAGLEGAPHAQ